MLSKKNRALVEAYNRGYRIINGKLYNPKGEKLIGNNPKNGYKSFSINKTFSKVNFHKLVAYQKYGSKIFEADVEVRHIDNDKLNNNEENIKIGTHQENMMDIPKKQRIENAGNQSRKYNYEEVREYYNQTKSYKNTMKKFGISSKGTLNYILNTPL